MSKINKYEMLSEFCKVYSDFRDYIVDSSNEWISLDGRFMWIVITSSLAEFVLNKIKVGNYDDVDEFFLLIERLVIEGDLEVSTLVTTELLESMMNNKTIEGELWRPFLREKSLEYCIQIDDFNN